MIALAALHQSRDSTAPPYPHLSQALLPLAGLATSFFNEKNRNVAREMVELLSEASQEVPSWIESIAYEARSTYPKQRSNRGGGGRGAFGGKDYRQQGGRGGQGMKGGYGQGGMGQQGGGYGNPMFQMYGGGGGGYGGSYGGGGGGGSGSADWWGS